MNSTIITVLLTAGLIFLLVTVGWLLVLLRRQAKSRFGHEQAAVRPHTQSRIVDELNLPPQRESAQTRVARSLDSTLTPHAEILDGIAQLQSRVDVLTQQFQQLRSEFFVLYTEPVDSIQDQDDQDEGNSHKIEEVLERGNRMLEQRRAAMDDRGAL